jgi:hypothetical protein
MDAERMLPCGCPVFAAQNRLVPSLVIVIGLVSPVMRTVGVVQPATGHVESVPLA